MKLKLLDGEYAIGKASDFSQVDYSAEFIFLAKTDEEYSIVCPAGLLPSNCIEKSFGWRAFRVEGILDFSLTGILARISSALANRSIALFAVSTFNTDYILIKADRLDQAADTLAAADFTF